MMSIHKTPPLGITQNVARADEFIGIKAQDESVSIVAPLLNILVQILEERRTSKTIIVVCKKVVLVLASNLKWAIGAVVGNRAVACDESEVDAVFPNEPGPYPAAKASAVISGSNNAMG